MMVVVLFSQKINDTVIRGKNNTVVAGNGKEHQVQMICSCFFLPFGILWQCHKFVMVWEAERQASQRSRGSPMIPMNLAGWFSKAQRFARKNVWPSDIISMPRKIKHEQQRSPPKNAHGRNLHQIGLLQWLLNWRCHAHRHFREFSKNYHMEHTLNILQ